MKFVRTEVTAEHPATVLNINYISSVYLGNVNGQPALWAKVDEGSAVKEHPLRICVTEEEAHEYLERFSKIAGNAIDISSRTRTADLDE